VVIVRTSSLAPTATITGAGATLVTQGGYKIYTFPNTGSITW